MLSKNKLNKFYEDKNTLKHKDKDKDTDKDKTIPKTKIEGKDMLDKINNKIITITTSTILAKIMDKLNNNKIKLIYDSRLRLVELNKIDAIIDDALNITWNMIHKKKKNRISSNKINIDKYKDIDGYVNKLTDVIDNKIELFNRVGDSIDHTISDIKN